MFFLIDSLNGTYRTSVYSKLSSHRYFSIPARLQTGLRDSSSGELHSFTTRFQQLCCNSGCRLTGNLKKVFFSFSVTNPNPPKPDAKLNDLRSLHRCSKADKWLLVHFQKFPKGEVPDYVP